MDRELFNQNCALAQHRNGVYELVILRPTRRAVDELLDYLVGIGVDPLQPYPLRLLINNSLTETMPIQYVVNKMRLMGKNLPASRLALMFNDPTLNKVTLQLVDLLRLPKTELAYFAPDERHEAIDWLLRDG
ncbi:MAG: hypothetical protein MUF87_09420 [Anaerolineae bacterium]|jgi:hypothetical protein|nr:hypothetical protein [Anaerolineae bacterium]